MLTDELSRLDDEQCTELYERIGWDAECLRIARPLWCAAQRRFAFPVYDPMGRRRGYVLRSYEGAQPKALTYIEEGDTSLSWYVYHTGPVVIVEDIPSAVRGAKYGNTVALSGTGSGPNAIAEIAAHARQVIWCLDKDATAVAIRAMTRNRMAFDTSYVVPLQCDLKDMGEESLAEFLGEVYGKCGAHTPSRQLSAEVL